MSDDDYIADYERLPESFKRLAIAQRDDEIRHLENRIAKLRDCSWIEWACSFGVALPDATYRCGLRIGKPWAWRRETSHSERYVSTDELIRLSGAGL